MEKWIEELRRRLAGGNNWMTATREEGLALIAHIGRLEAENELNGGFRIDAERTIEELKKIRDDLVSTLATYKSVVEKAEWVLSRSRRVDNYITGYDILGISFEDYNALQQSLQAAKEAK